MIAVILGFMPALDRRLSIATKSGTGKGRSKPRHNADDLRPLKMGDEQARRVVHCQLLTSNESDHADEEKIQRKSL